MSPPLSNALRRTGIAVLLVVCLAAARPARADGRAIVLMLPALDGEALARELLRSRWTALREQSAVALMTTVTPLPRTLKRAVRPLATGALEERPDPSAMADLLRARRVQTAYLGPPARGGVEGPAALAAGATARRIAFRVPAGEALSARLLLAASRPQQLLWVEAGPLRPEEALTLVERLAIELDAETDLLILVAPAARPVQPSAPERLAGALFCGREWAGRGVWSPGTRTPGLIANVDFAPTLLAHFGVPPPAGMTGRAAVPRGRSSLTALQKAARQARISREALYPVAILLAFLAFVAVGLSLFRSAYPDERMVSLERLLRWTPAFVAAAISAPAAVLLAGLARPESAFELLTWIISLVIVLGGLSVGLGRRGSPAAVAAMVSAGVVVGDLLTGGRLLATGVLGNFAITGVRFYGIGNEYAGLLIGWGVLAVGFGLEARGRVTTSLAWLGAALLPAILGLPQWGANFGAGIAVTVGVIALARARLGVRWRWSETLVWIGVAAAAGAALWWAHGRWSGGESHVGRLAEQVRQVGWGALADVALRKAALNWRMLTSWQFLTAAAVFAPLIALWYHWNGALAAAAIRARPGLRAALIGGLAAAATGLIVNDTGVTLAALTAGVLALGMLDAMLTRKSEAR